MFSLDRFDDIWQHEIDGRESNLDLLINFNAEDFCTCGNRGLVTYHDDYIEELMYKKCKKTWQRRNK